MSFCAQRAASSAEFIVANCWNSGGFRVGLPIAVLRGRTRPSLRNLPVTSRCPLCYRSLPIRSLALIWWARWFGCGNGAGIEIRRIEIIFSGNANEREQGIAPCVSEGGSHSLY